MGNRRLGLDWVWNLKPWLFQRVNGRLHPSVWIGLDVESEALALLVGRLAVGWKGVDGGDRGGGGGCFNLEPFANICKDMAVWAF